MNEGDGPYRTAPEKENFPFWEDWLAASENRKISFTYENLANPIVSYVVIIQASKTIFKSGTGSNAQDAFEKALESLRKDVG